MHDCVEPGQLTGIGKYDRAQFPPVYFPIVLKYILPKRSNNFLPGFRMGSVRLMSHLIRIDNNGAKLLQNAGYFALAGANSTGQANDNHPDPSFQHDSAILPRG